MLWRGSWKGAEFLSTFILTVMCFAYEEKLVKYFDEDSVFLLMVQLFFEIVFDLFNFMNEFRYS